VFGGGRVGAFLCAARGGRLVPCCFQIIFFLAFERGREACVLFLSPALHRRLFRPASTTRTVRLACLCQFYRADDRINGASSTLLVAAAPRG
jgi:hypothetical protein